MPAVEEAKFEGPHYPIPESIRPMTELQLRYRSHLGNTADHKTCLYVIMAYA